tara:strand:+ start:1546 stop:1896 length:351 start_codon:yes stop_codon:yes gene_type:complete
MAADGSITPLVELARSGTAGAKEQAAWALGDLALNQVAMQVAIAAEGGIAPLVELARSGTAGAKEQAAWALRNLADNDAPPTPKSRRRGRCRIWPSTTTTTRWRSWRWAASRCSWS